MYAVCSAERHYTYISIDIRYIYFYMPNRSYVSYMYAVQKTQDLLGAKIRMPLSASCVCICLPYEEEDACLGNTLGTRCICLVRLSMTCQGQKCIWLMHLCMIVKDCGKVKAGVKWKVNFRKWDLALKSHFRKSSYNFTPTSLSYTLTLYKKMIHRWCLCAWCVWYVNKHRYFLWMNCLHKYKYRLYMPCTYHALWLHT